MPLLNKYNNKQKELYEFYLGIIVPISAISYPLNYNDAEIRIYK